MRTLRVLPLTALAVLALVGCKPKTRGDMPICAAEVAGGTAVESNVQELPANIWYSIMIQGFDRDQMLPGDDPKDCTGTSTLAPTPPPYPEDVKPPADDQPDIVAGCKIGGPLGGEEGVTRLPIRPLTEDDILISEAPNGKSLVWVQATHFNNGEAIGPVALVEWTKAGIAVRALGSLRAHTYKARMRIEDAGDQRILVVESDQCNTEERKLCKRIMRLLPIIDGRFATVPLKLGADASLGKTAAPVVTPTGDCLGDAAFALFEQYTANLPDGWIRRFEINRSVTFEKGEPVVSEQVVIKDRDPSQPDSPPQDFREASSNRTLTYKDRYFETRGSLWEDMINSYGSVAHDAKPVDD
jgi:hypothetical protein